MICEHYIVIVFTLISRCADQASTGLLLYPGPLQGFPGSSFESRMFDFLSILFLQKHMHCLVSVPYRCCQNF